jgi:hypothetical protein
LVDLHLLLPAGAAAAAAEAAVAAQQQQQQQTLASHLSLRRRHGLLALFLGLLSEVAFVSTAAFPSCAEAAAAAVKGVQVGTVKNVSCVRRGQLQ